MGAALAKNERSPGCSWLQATTPRLCGDDLGQQRTGHTGKMPQPTENRTIEPASKAKLKLQPAPRRQPLRLSLLGLQGLLIIFLTAFMPNTEQLQLPQTVISLAGLIALGASVWVERQLILSTVQSTLKDRLALITTILIVGGLISLKGIGWQMPWAQILFMVTMVPALPLILMLMFRMEKRQEQEERQLELAEAAPALPISALNLREQALIDSCRTALEAELMKDGKRLSSFEHRRLRWLDDVAESWQALDPAAREASELAMTLEQLSPGCTQRAGVASSPLLASEGQRRWDETRRLIEEQANPPTDLRLPED